MTDIPRKADPQDHDTVREAAEASQAAKSREHRRAEREQKAYASHFRDTPQSPQ